MRSDAELSREELLDELARQRQAAEENGVVAAQMKALFTSSPDYIFVKDAERRYLWVNNAFCDLFGVSADQLIGKRDEELFPPQLAERGIADDLDVIERGKHVINREEGGGDFPWVLTTKIGWEDSDGNTGGVLGVSRDITDRRRAEDALRQREHELSLIQRTVKDVIYHIGVEADGGYRFISTNPAFLTATGLSEEQVFGQQIEAVIPATSLDLVREKYSQAIREKRTVRWEETSDYPTGRRHGLVAVTPVFDAQDRCAHLVGSVHDVTSMKRAHDELRRLSKVFMDGADPILIEDLDGRVTDMNDEAVRAYGYERSELIGEPITQIVPPEHHQEVAERRRRCQAGERVRSVESARLTKNGEILPVLLTFSLLSDEAGQPLGIASVSKDLTRLKRVESELIQAQKMDALGQLAGGVAHDLNNVLAVVLGLGSVLESELSADHPVTPDIREIIAAARRGKSLVENLLGFARKGKYQKKRVSLNDTVRDLVEVLSRSLPKKIALQHSLDDNLAPVECDPTQLAQVLMNICLNANDALQGSGTINIRTRNETLRSGEVGGLAAGDYVRVEIADDGPGMDEEVRRRAFEPFFTTKEIGRGTGLGLSMAYGVIQNHGGAIRLESGAGRGTKLSIWLAAASAPEARLDEAEHVAAVPPARRRKVLLIDDEPMVRRFGQRMLESAGFEAIVADGGAAGLRLYERLGSEIALVLLDLSMPIMDGAECFARIKAQDADAKVLICTGHGKAGLAEAMVEKGALGVLRKPFDMDELTQAIANALD